MKNKILDNLIESGILKDYKYVAVDEDDVEIKDHTYAEESASRNTERLILIFSNDQILKIDTFCSGILENTELFLDDRINPCDRHSTEIVK